MAILVTGGAGFIGSHIVDKLIEEGEGVIVVDNLSTGKKENINPKAKFYEVDIRSQKKLDSVFQENRIKKVIHQAAQPSVTKSVEDPVFDAQVNILGSINLLECCRKYDVRKIIYASSAAIYGQPQQLPLTEDHLIDPLSPYGNSKHLVETYLQLYQRLHGVNYTSLRYSNVYGPRQDSTGEAGVIAIFAHNLLWNKPSIIYGDGKQTRDFVYVNDIVSANFLSLEKGDNRSFNLGTSSSVSINDLFALMKKISSSSQNVSHVPPRSGEIKHSSLDASLARRELTWELPIPLEEGLTKTLDYFKNHHG